MKADAMTEMAVKAVLNKVAEGYSRRNMDILKACFAQDPDVVMYGTGADERRIGLAEIQAQAERDWSQSDSASMKYTWTSVSASGPLAWVAADAIFDAKVDGQAISLPVRITCVMEKRGANWLIVQAHFSFPAMDQAEGESFPA